MNGPLLQKLRQLYQKDQEMREYLRVNNRLYGRYEESMQQIHRQNAQALDELVSAHGWPGISQVGKEGCRLAWMIAQHAICTPDLQRKFLRCLQKAAEHADAPIRQVAFLTDRIAFSEGKPQLYGTVLDWNEQGELDCELLEPDKIDARRAQVGLPPFVEDRQAHRQAVAQEGGTAPDDYAAYRQAQLAWAKKVGWS